APDIRERTLIAVKPDGVQRRLVGEIVKRFEHRGFKLVGMKMLQASEGILSEHYHDLRRKPFYPSLIRNIIHASDSVEVAEREISLWFHGSELIEWEMSDHNDLYQV
ncbi:hypothetical protein AB205_0001800, partial [Aquarana catesbeiana]